MKSVLLLLMVLLAGTSAYALQLAWLLDPVEGPPRVDWQPSITALQAAGLEVQTLDYQALAAGALAQRDFGALMLPNASLLPPECAAPLEAFLKAGGDLVTLQGTPFQEALLKEGDGWRAADHVFLEGQWMSREEARRKALVEARPVHLQLDFETEDLSLWQRNSNQMDEPGSLSLVKEGESQALRLSIKGLSGWDTQARALPGPIAGGDNCFVFRARSDAPQTPALVVELDEEDGTRWIGKVALTPDWRWYALLAEDFACWGGSGRDARGEQLTFQRATRLSLGLAFGISAQPEGDHALLVDDIGTSSVELYEAKVPRLDFRLKDLSDALPLPLTGLTAPITADLLPLLWPSGVPLAGEELLPFPRPEQEAWLPLIEASDSQGRSRCLAGALVHFAGPYEGSQWLAWAVTEPAYYQSEEFRQGLPQALTWLASESTLQKAKAKAEEELADRQIVGSCNFLIGAQNFSPRYHFTEDSLLVESALELTALGATSFKGELSRRVFATNTREQPVYDLAPSPDVTTLVQLAQQPDYRRLFALPIHQYVFWTYPLGGASYIPDEDDSPHYGFCKPMTARQRENEYREFYDLTAWLLATYSGTGKQFFLGNWEGDGMLAIASAGWGNNPSEEAVQAMIDRLRVRQQAVSKARAATPHHEVEVYHYLECNNVTRPMRGEAMRTVVADVLPFVDVDYVSYSSYEATVKVGTAELASDYQRNLDFILTKAPARVSEEKRLLIGEFGWPASTATPLQQKERTRQVLLAALRWGSPLALYWQLYDNEGTGYWMIDDHGVRQPVHTLYQRCFKGARRWVVDFQAEEGRLPTTEELRPVVTKLLEEAP